MKFVAPKKGSSGVSTGGPHRVISRPEWLKEWIENQGHYVELSCGCMEDQKTRGLLMVFLAGGLKGREIEILCVRCDKWVWLTRSVSLREYLGLPKAQSTEEPLF